MAITSKRSQGLPLSGGTLTGPLLFTDNAVDIGSAAARVRTLYVGTSWIVGDTVGGTQKGTVRAIASDGTPSLAWYGGATQKGLITMDVLNGVMIFGQASALSAKDWLFVSNLNSGSNSFFYLSASSATQPFIGFGTNAPAVTTIDANLSRVSSGVIGVGTGTAGSVAGEIRALVGTFGGTVATAAPAGSSAGLWKLGALQTAAVVLDTTRSIYVDIGGTVYKLMVAQ